MDEHGRGKRKKSRSAQKKGIGMGIDTGREKDQSNGEDKRGRRGKKGKKGREKNVSNVSCILNSALLLQMFPRESTNKTGMYTVQTLNLEPNAISLSHFKQCF